MNNYPVENKLREATEFYSAITLISLAALSFFMPHVLLLTPSLGQYAAISLSLFGLYRGRQGYLIKRYHRRLLKMPYFSMSTRQVPLSKDLLYVGQGFQWFPKHTQRLNQIKQVKNEAFMKPGKLKSFAYLYCEKNKSNKRNVLAQILSKNSIFNPFRPLPDVGGKPYLHGVGDEDRAIYIPQSVRVGHTFVVGTTRVGKTRLASILINQDIRNGDAIIVVDPKGDLELVRDMYSACNAAGRLEDFRIVHLGFPELSAQYNPLKNFDQVSEVATRITSAIDAEGEGKQFAAFAWKYVTIISICLEEMKKPITYKSIDFYKSRLDLLLVSYADTVLPGKFPDYLEAVEEIKASHDTKLDKFGNTPLPMDRGKAVLGWLKKYISDNVAKGNIESLQDQIIIDLYDAAIMDKTYYDKITASVGPVLSEINKSNASNIFSFKHSSSEVELMASIKERKVIYIGLDSLTNTNIAQAVGKAILSDLVSTAGKIYKEGNMEYRLNLHCDELSEIIQESFVKILNKAGGAGFQVTAYAQTKQDLEVALGSKAMAEVTKGNLNTLIMLRVENEETANMLINVLAKVDVVNHTEVSMVSDTPHGEEGIYFNTTNEDRVQKNAISMLEVNDITSLPKGQAFIIVNGGELYKIRIPLPVNDGLAPADIKTVLRQINKLDETQEEVSAEIKAEIEIKEEEPNFEMEKVVINPILEEKEEVAGGDERFNDFKDWLFNRMHSGNRQFNLEEQRLVVSNEREFGNQTVFVCDEVLAKYQSRTGVLTSDLKAYLKASTHYMEENGTTKTLYPITYEEPLKMSKPTLILKGEKNEYDN